MPAKRDERFKGRRRGLQTEINPVLLSSNPNLIKTQYQGQNPYLSPPGQNDVKIRRRYERGLQFHERGEVSAAIERERSRLKEQELARQKEKELEAQRQEERRALVAKGELPDTSIGEEKYIPGEVPAVEWWDRDFLNEQLEILPKYTTEAADDASSDEEDEHPSIRYVEHPVPIRSETSKPVSKVYLTKDEQKKIRRNRRKLKREEKDTRIKMGLDPKPDPKVSLRNMMHVYENNSNISDPTSWEHIVRQQVAQRRQKHEEINAKRHEEALEKRKAKTIAPGDHCKVFSFQNLSNPRIRYKLKTNARQLSLRGLCVRVGNDGSGVIVVVGSEKSCKFYDKLVTRRIKWDESYEDQQTNELVDMTGNHSMKIWEGELKNPSFGPFFMKVCEDEDEMREVLRQRNAEHLLTSINSGK